MKNVLKLLPLVLAIVFLTSCNNYGKKVTVDGTKGEVYYKGDGVTEADAKNVGNYLKKIGFLTNEKNASVQIMKPENTYVVRFVFNKNFYDKTPDAESSFKVIGAEMSKAIFSGKKVDIALADSTMKDFRTIPYDATADKETTPAGDTDSTK